MKTTKKILICLTTCTITSGCSLFPLLNSTVNDINNAFLLNKKIVVTENIKKLPYAMQKITINDQEAILVLKNAKNDNLHWVDAENSEIVTRSGKIIKTYNLPNNIETIYNYDLFQVYQNLLENSQQINKKGWVKFSAPKTKYLEIKNTYSLIESGNSLISVINERPIKYKLVKESFSVEDLEWEGENYYWISDDSFNVIKSKQAVFPNARKIRTTLLKAYKK
jgi:hypothetical protein